MEVKKRKIMAKPAKTLQTLGEFPIGVRFIAGQIIERNGTIPSSFVIPSLFINDSNGYVDPNEWVDGHPLVMRK
jgi:hypothetical protein